MLLRLAILIFGVFVAVQTAVAEASDPIIVGEADAPIVIDLYTSPTCGFCKNFHENNIAGMTERYIDRGHIQLRIHDIYTEPVALSFLSSVLFRCVYDRDGYESYKAIKTNYYASFQKFAKSQDLAADFLSLGAQHGFDEAAVTTCSNRQDLRDKVQAASVQASEYKSRLPILVVNGELFDPASTDPLMQGEHEIQDMIDRLLNDRLVDDPDLAERNTARDELMSVEFGIEYLERDAAGDKVELRNSANWNKIKPFEDEWAYLGFYSTREAARTVLAELRSEHGDDLKYQIDFFEPKGRTAHYRVFVGAHDDNNALELLCNRLNEAVADDPEWRKCPNRLQWPLP